MNISCCKSVSDIIICPFGNRNLDICQALDIKREVNQTVKSKYCCSDDYDHCPLFLIESLILKDDL